MKEFLIKVRNHFISNFPKFLIVYAICVAHFVMEAYSRYGSQSIVFAFLSATVCSFAWYILLIVSVINKTERRLGDLNKVMKENGRYSDEYINLLKSKVKDNKTPHDAMYKMEIATCLEYRNQLQESLEMLDSIINKGIRNKMVMALVYATKAKVLVKLGNAYQAEDVITKNVSLIKKYIRHKRLGTEINYILALIDFAFGRTEKAEEKLSQIGNYIPDAVDKTMYNILSALCCIKLNKKSLIQLNINDAEKNNQNNDWWNKEIFDKRISVVKEIAETGDTSRFLEVI